MSTYTSEQVQRRNAQSVGIGHTDFTRRSGFYENGARLDNAVRTLHRQGGSQLQCGWLADSPEVHGLGSLAQFVESGASAAYYGATTNGGPYATADGQASYFYIDDANWQEQTTPAGATLALPFLVWEWVYPTNVAALQVHRAKWLTAGNQRSWTLRHTAAGLGQFSVSSLGTAATVVSVDTAVALTANVWNFLAGLFHPGAFLRIWRGLATDTALVLASNAVGIPANVFDGTADLTMGAEDGPGSYLAGRLGIFALRRNLPTATISAYVSRLFHETRWFYQQ